MSLPKIDHPVYEITLSCSPKPIKYRPFLVKEQKLLMMASSSKDTKSLIETIKQLIRNCCIDEIDVDNLPIHDMEKLFLELRARSIGENVDVYFKCNATTPNDQTDADATASEEVPCGMIINVKIDLLKDVKVKENSNFSNTIMVNQNIGVKLKHPTIDHMEIFEKIEEADDPNLIDDLIASCIDVIFDNEQVYRAKDATKEELQEFINCLSADAYSKLENYIANSPTIQYVNSHSCPKCGSQHTINLEGIADFFT